MAIPGTPPGCPVQFVQTLRCAHPEIGVAIFVDGTNFSAAQAGWIPRIVPVMTKRSALRIEAVQPASGPHPQRASRILIDTVDAIAAQALVDIRFVPVMCEGASVWIQPVETFRRSSDPQNAAPVFVKGLDVVTAEAIRVVRIVAEMNEGIAVVPEQAGIAGEPDEPLIILRDGSDPPVKGLAVRRQPDETDVLPVDDWKPLDAARQCGWGSIRRAGAQQNQGANEQEQVQRRILPSL